MAKGKRKTQRTGKRRTQRTGKRRTQRAAEVPEITAVALTEAGYAYIAAVWPGLLEGGVGELSLKPAAQDLIHALHQIATGGSLESVNAVGGKATSLDNLLSQSIAEANRINELLGVIRVMT